MVLLVRPVQAGSRRKKCVIAVSPPIRWRKEIRAPISTYLRRAFAAFAAFSAAFWAGVSETEAEGAAASTVGLAAMILTSALAKRGGRGEDRARGWSSACKKCAKGQHQITGRRGCRIVQELAEF